jgi:hypothetical protein
MVNRKELVLRRLLSFARKRKDFRYSFDFDDYSGCLRLASQDEGGLARADNEDDFKFLAENPNGMWSMADKLLLHELLKDMSTWDCICSWEPYDENDHGPTYVKQFWDTAVKLTGDKIIFYYKDKLDDNVYL